MKPKALVSLLFSRWRKWWTSVVLLVLMCITGGVAREWVSEPPVGRADMAGVPFCRLVFVGNAVVDLKWDPIDPSYEYWKVLRDGGPVVTDPDISKTFFRDKGRSKGAHHNYQFCVGKSGQPDECTAVWVPSAWAGWVVSDVMGTIYDDLSWSGDDYVLREDVKVAQDVTLSVGSRVAVSAAARLDLTDQGEGAIQVSQATIGPQIKLWLQSGDSVLSSSTITGASQVIVGGGTAEPIQQTLADNHFFSSTLFLSASSSEVAGGRFEWSTVHVDGDEVTISDNTFAPGRVRVGCASCEVEVSENHFFTHGAWSHPDDYVPYYNAINVRDCASLTISDNKWRTGSQLPTGDAAIGIASGDCPTAIERNVIDAHPAHAYGIYQDDNSASGLTIRNNIIASTVHAIELRGTVHDPAAEVIGNQLVGTPIGGDAIQVRGDGAHVIQNNCIQPAHPSTWGLYVADRSSPLEATQNWWGDPSGPRHASNPGGTGAQIYWDPGGGEILYSPVLSASNCTTTDLTFTGVEVVQVVQDLNNSVPLVAGKPTVLRVYVDSGVGSADGVTAEVTGYRDGQQLAPPAAVVGSVQVAPVTDRDAVRAHAGGGLLYRLPEDWLTGTVTFRVELNPGRVVTEAAFVNNTMTRTLA